MDLERIHLVLREAPEPTAAGYDLEIDQILRSFLNTQPTVGEMLEAHSVLFCYPAVDMELFEGRCSFHKKSFIEREMLLGKFHPEIKLHSLDDPKHWFKPCPRPILALRQLIPEDIRFLEQNRIVSDRGELVEAYEKVFTQKS